jgi:hypothetical protein
VASTWLCCEKLCFQLGDVLWCDQDGDTALLVACRFGQLDVAKWLVTHAGSDVRAKRKNVSCALCCQLLASDGVVVCSRLSTRC